MRNSSLIFLLLCTITARADMLACLEPGVKETLLTYPSQPPAEITKTPPYQLRDVSLPQDFDLLGARSGEHFSMASYRTRTSQPDAITQLASALEDSGWSENHPQHGPPSGGIQHRQRPRHSGTRYCHDELGFVTANYAMVDDQRYVVMLINPHHDNRTCKQQMSPRHHFASVMELPTVFLPDDVSDVSGTGFGGGNGEEAHSRSSFTSSRSLADLEKHFSSQVSSQGFEFEDNWLGVTTAGSVWLSSDGKHHLMIRVSLQKPERYKIVMTKSLRMTGRASATGAISISSG